MLTEKEQLEYCKTCKNKALDFKTGLVCSLTNTRRTFETSCPDYTEDEVETFKKAQAEQAYQEIKKELETPVWKIILSIVIGLVALIRLVMAFT